MGIQSSHSNVWVLVKTATIYFLRRTAVLILRPAIAGCPPEVAVNDFVDLWEQTQVPLEHHHIHTHIHKIINTLWLNLPNCTSNICTADSWLYFWIHIIQCSPGGALKKTFKQKFWLPVLPLSLLGEFIPMVWISKYCFTLSWGALIHKISWGHWWSYSSKMFWRCTYGINLKALRRLVLKW